MASVVSIKSPRATYLYLHFVFYKDGVRYRGREGTGLVDTPANRAIVKAHGERIELKKKLGIFNYLDEFPAGNLRHHFAGDGKPIASTFREYAETWLKENAPPHGFKPSTYQDYRSTLNVHLLPAFGSLPLDSITEQALKLFRQKLAGLSPKRVNNIFVPLKTMIKEAYRRGVVNSDPTEHIKPLETGTSDVYPLSLREIALLLDMLPAFWSQFFAVAFYTGMRTGELLALQWRDVDFRDGIISVRRSITRGVEGLPKTRGSQRDANMLAPVYGALNARAWAYSCGLGVSRYVFPNMAGKPLDADHVRERVWLPALKRAGIPRRTLYQTRHTFASLMLKAGEEPLYVAGQMGTSPEMLFKRYARYITSATRRDGSAMERMLQGV